MIYIPLVFIVIAQFIVLVNFLDAYSVPKLLFLSIAGTIGTILCIRRNKNILSWQWGLFFLTTLVGSLLSINPPGSIFGDFYLGWETLLFLVVCYGCYCYGLLIDREKIYTALSIAGIISSIVGLSQIFGFEHDTHWVGSHRLGGTMGHPVFYGAMLLIGIVPTISLLLKNWRWVFALIPQVICLFATASRGAIIGTMIASIVLSCHRLSNKLKNVFIFSVVILSCLLIAHRWIYGVGGISSDSMRLVQCKIAVKAFIEHPFFGYGPACYLHAFCKLRNIRDVIALGGPAVIQRNAHCLPLNILATEGLFGFLSWSVMLFFMWKNFDIVGKALISAIFFVGLFNPIPQPCYAILALIIGKEGNVKLYRKYLNYLIVFIVSLSLLFVSRLSLADSLARHGQGIAAINIAPQNFLYRAVAIMTSEPEKQLEIAKAGVKINPNGSLSWFQLWIALTNNRDNVSADNVKKKIFEYDRFLQLKKLGAT